MKKWKLAVTAGILAFAIAGCGTQKTEDIGSVDISSVSEVRTEGDAQEGEPIEGDAQVSEPTEGEVEEKNDNFADLEEQAADGDVASFAGQIQAAIAAKDMEALADLCAYPLAVNGEAVDSREAFMELGTDVVFTEERCAVIEAVDVSALEETMAGVIMGDATPNIIFKSVDGELKITGIN